MNRGRRGLLRLIGGICIGIGAVLLLAPVAWVAYTARQANAVQLAALAEWETRYASGGLASGTLSVSTPSGPAKVRSAASRPPASSGMILTIPRLQLKRYVPEGAGVAQLRRYGVGRISWTTLPQQAGTLSIAGHRTTYGAPFLRVHLLQPGDLILVDHAGRRYTYGVVGQRQVRPHDVGVLRAPAAGGRAIALVTCSPPYSAAYRLVVLGRLRSVAPAAPPG